MNNMIVFWEVSNISDIHVFGVFWGGKCDKIFVRPSLEASLYLFIC